MRMMVENAERELYETFASIVRDPSSWEGWRCLHIETRGLDSLDGAPEVQMSISLLLEDMFRQASGEAYFCSGGEIFVVVKGAGEGRLRDSGHLIADIIGAKTRLSSVISVHELSSGDGLGISQAVLNAFMDRLTHAPAHMVKRSELFICCDSAELTVSRSLDPEKNKRVLLVEDDPVTRWIVRGALKEECQLATAAGAGRALSAYCAYHPDIVFLDINLPDGNGLEVLKILLEADPAAYIVMFSSHDSVNNMSLVINGGARGFVAKPFSRDRLLHYIHACPSGR